MPTIVLHTVCFSVSLFLHHLLYLHSFFFFVCVYSIPALPNAFSQEIDRNSLLPQHPVVDELYTDLLRRFLNLRVRWAIVYLPTLADP